MNNTNKILKLQQVDWKLLFLLPVNGPVVQWIE